MTARKGQENLEQENLEPVVLRAWKKWHDHTASKNIVIQASAKRQRWHDRQHSDRAWHLTTIYALQILYTA